MKEKNLLDPQQQFETAENHQISIDLTPILEDCMGEMELLQELLFLFDQNALEFIGAAKIHLFDYDFKALGLAAHKIKAGLAMMRTENLHAIVVLVQKECDGDQDHKHLQFLCDCFAEEYPTVKEAINAALATVTQA